MDIFKKPAVAIILAVIACFAILIFNTRSKLGAEISAVEDGFYTSVEGQRSIYSRLQEKLQASNGIWTVLNKYDEEAAEELSYEREYLIWAMDDASISSMTYANEDLDTAVTEAVKKLDSYELTDDEVALVDEYEQTYNGASKMIAENSYNTDVLEFMRSTYNTFPTSEIAEFAGVYPPTTFN